MAKRKQLKYPEAALARAYDKKHIEAVEKANARADSLEVAASELMRLAERIRVDAQQTCPHPEADRSTGTDIDGRWELCDLCGKTLD